MLLYMGTVTVILLNILKAQMNTTYIQAKKVARVEYDVDGISQLTRHCQWLTRSPEKWEKLAE